MKKETILVFTGGGLAPALNPTLYGVIKEAKKYGYRILGGMYGWSCLTKNGKVIDLTNFNPDPLKFVGGTFLRSSRTNIMGLEDGVEVAKEKLKEYKVDHIVAIGGDDTLGAANRLFQEEKVNIVGLPKTVDNDLQATYWTPGFPTAAHATAQFCREIKIDAAYALSRIFIVEVLGRSSGWLAASGAYGYADLIVPPEKEVKLDDVLKYLAASYERNGNYATMVISEEANFGHAIKGIEQDQKDTFKVKRKSFVALSLKQKIKENLGIDCKPLFPGNFVQTGKPLKIDADYAARLGKRAIDLIKKGKFGYMAAIDRPSYNSLKLQVKDVSLKVAVGQERLLDDSFFDFKKFQVKKKFYDYMEPILGKFKPEQQDKYVKMISKLNKHVK